MKYVCRTISLSSLAVVLYIAIVPRFANPDMTETQLLVAHWKLYAGGIVLAYALFYGGIIAEALAQHVRECKK